MQNGYVEAPCRAQAPLATSSSLGDFITNVLQINYLRANRSRKHRVQGPAKLGISQVSVLNIVMPIARRPCVSCRQIP
jgi:hypothetical protein